VSRNSRCIAKVDLEGVTGRITFDKNGDADKDMAFIKVVEKGQFKFLKTVSVI
jgi:branched-chain amino acid transport system substrate-binding protein